MSHGFRSPQPSRIDSNELRRIRGLSHQALIREHAAAASAGNDLVEQARLEVTKAELLRRLGCLPDTT